MQMVKTVQRQKFEEEALPHLAALWRTTLWLTMRGNLAEDLVLKTMTRAYHEWHDSSDSTNSKARLFRTLAREFFSGGQRWHRLPQPRHSPSKSIRTTVGFLEMGTQNTMPEKEYGQPQLPPGVTDASVREVIALLKPYHRLLVALLFSERFSYADISYITDLKEISVKVLLGRLRRQILQLLAQHSGHSVTPVNNWALQTHSASLEGAIEVNPHEGPGTVGQVYGVDAGTDRWENEGGTPLGRLQG